MDNFHRQQEMETYYLFKTSSSKVEEIRSKVEINGTTKYIIDKKSGVEFVDAARFYDIPMGYKTMRIE